MNTIKSISIPEPCSQQWLQMTPVDGGRHCESCCKAVTDFTLMTDNQIINLLSSRGNLCGRIQSGQLYRINLSLLATDNTGFSWRKLGIVSALAGVISVNLSEAQSRIPPHRLNLQSKINTNHTKHGRQRSLESRSLTTKDIKIDTRLNDSDPKVISHEIDELNYYPNLNNALADKIGNVRIGGFIVRYSFTRRLWRTITRPVRKLF